MIEEINEFVNRIEAIPTNSLPAESCSCSCSCSCGAEYQMWWTPGQMNSQGWYYFS